ASAASGAPASAASAGPASAAMRGPASVAARAAIQARPLVDRRGSGIAAVCGELLAAGESVLAICADARRRADGLEQLVAGIALDDARFAVIGWSDFVADPSHASGFRHLVAIDPPPVAELLGVAARAPAAGGGYLGWARAD